MESFDERESARGGQGGEEAAPPTRDRNANAEIEPVQARTCWECKTAWESASVARECERWHMIEREFIRVERAA
jgi:hypothetical protein